MTTQFKKVNGVYMADTRQKVLNIVGYTNTGKKKLKAIVKVAQMEIAVQIMKKQLENI